MDKLLQCGEARTICYIPDDKGLNKCSSNKNYINLYRLVKLRLPPTLWPTLLSVWVVPPTVTLAACNDMHGERFVASTGRPRAHHCHCSTKIHFPRQLVPDPVPDHLLLHAVTFSHARPDLTCMHGSPESAGRTMVWITHSSGSVITISPQV